VSVAFDRAAGYYDESRGLCPEVQELVADRIEEAAGPGARLLEVGVGTGRIALPLHRRGRRSGPTPPACPSPTPASTPCSRSMCCT
jgi:ubiquinone/menaquinone biosynthesis C-methylase UbiE